MPEFVIRKIAVLTEEIFHEGGPAAEKPRRRAAAMALVRNPFAGRYVAELEGAMEDLKPLGLELTDRLKARRLVALTPHSQDRRRLLVELTPEGRTLVERLLPLARDITDQTLAPLTPREASALLRLLAKLAEG